MCVRLPIWRRGCGIRSRLSLAPAAFCSTAALPSVLHAIASSTTRMADGVTRPGAADWSPRCRAGVLVGLDGCEVRLCDPCARVRPCVPCVSRLPPVCHFTVTELSTFLR